MSNKRNIITSITTVIGLLATPIFAQNIIGLGYVPGGWGSVGYGVNDDGSVVVGDCFVPPGFQRAFRWTGAGGMANLGTLAGGNHSYGDFVSGNGSVVVGTSNSGNSFGRVFRWTSTGGMVGITPASNQGTHHVTGISRDGNVVVGYIYSPAGTSVAYKWTSANGFASLPGLAGGSLAYANGVSGNGLIVVGDCDGPSGFTAVRWNSNGTITNLGTLNGGGSSSALAANYDGTVVLCSAIDSSGNQRITRWTSSGMQDLGPLPGREIHGISADALTVVGVMDSATGDRAFLWTPTLGIRDLNTYLPMLGISTSGWFLWQANGISTDGRSIVGEGTHGANDEAWVVTLDKDSDGDGLWDGWESIGIPYRKSNGTIGRYTLPGANVFRKDIYVEIDAMAGRSPSNAVLMRVKSAFAAAPFSPPAGAPPNTLGGIALQIVGASGTGVDDIISGGVHDYPNTFIDFQQDKQTFFGMNISTERLNSDWNSIKEAKKLAYRYCIFGNTFAGTPWSGIAEIGGNDFMVTLGGAYQAGLPLSVIEDMQARTFMHELGHTLGLNHGGAPSDNINNKPNYYSVMNYTWQLPSAWAPVGWPLRYSEIGLPTLNENALSEMAGLGGQYPGLAVPYSIPAGAANCVMPPSNQCWKYAFYGRRVNWDLNYKPNRPDTRPANINDLPDSDGTGSAAGQSLVGYNDWANLVYSFIGSPAYADGYIPPNLPPEMDVNAYFSLNSVPPPSPIGDGNCDSQFDGADIYPFVRALLSVNDYLALYPSCDPARLDFNDDGAIDGMDVGPFIGLLLAQ